MKRLLLCANILEFFLSHRLPLVAAAHEAGWEVHVAAADPVPPGVLPSYIQYHRIGMTRSGANPFVEFGALLNLYRLCRRIRPHVMHNVTVKPVLYGGIAARFARVPGVVAAVSGMGYVFTTKTGFTRILRPLVLAMYGLALGHRNCRVIVQNLDDQAALLGAGVLNPLCAVMIRGSGVNLEEFAVRPEPTGVPTVLMTARVLREKGVVEFAEAARAVKARMPARFLLAGRLDPDNPSAITEDELSPWLADGSIEWLGSRRDVPELLAQCNVYVLPSYREGVPKSLIEAAASGRAIVTTDVPGCREVVTHGYNGLLVRARSFQPLADAILQLLHNPETRAQMGCRNRKLAEQKYDVRDVVARHLAIYEDLYRRRLK